MPKENVHLDKRTQGRILRPKSVPHVEREKALIRKKKKESMIKEVEKLRIIVLETKRGANSTKGGIVKLCML